MLYPNIYGDAARASGDIGLIVELGGSTLLFVFKYHFYLFCCFCAVSSAGTSFYLNCFWMTLGGPVGTLSAMCRLHLTPVARVMATESRRNWLYFAGYQFRKNWIRRLFDLLLFCVFVLVLFLSLLSFVFFFSIFQHRIRQ